MNGGILRVREYGLIRLKIKEQTERRGLNRNQVAKLAGVRFEVADKWYQGKVERLDLDILARLCFVLDCEVSDLLEYQHPPKFE